MKRRHRHRPFPIAQSPIRWELLRPLVAFGIVAALLFTGGSWLVQRFGIGNAQQEEPVNLLVETEGRVQVSLEGGDWKPADSVRHLYPRDSVTTESSAHATLRFFDGSTMRLDEDSTAQISASLRSNRQSQVSLHLQQGSLWLVTPPASVASGSITRYVSTDLLSVDIPTGTEVVLTEDSIAVLNGEGQGCTVTVAGVSAPVVVGEGQTLTVPQNIRPGADLYTYRHPLAASIAEGSLVQESRSVTDAMPAETSESPRDTEEPVEAVDALILSTPQEGARIAEGTVTVAGTARPGTTLVRVNGYNAKLEASNRFSIDLALPERDDVTIVVEALNADGEVLDELRRSVVRLRKPPEPPTITRPVQNGQTLRTAATRFDIIGTPSEDAVAIIVNDYRLQFFEPGHATWKYLASTTLDNLKPGENVYNVYAVNAAGVQSAPATITVMLDASVGSGSVVTGGASETETPADGEEVSGPTPQNNPPLEPGTLTVDGPEPGTAHATSEVELLIEGIAPPGTDSVWVNDYRLRLYNPQHRIWNYIASTALGTMKRGENTYDIVIRNDQGQVIDRLTYTITFTPQAN